MTPQKLTNGGVLIHELKKMGKALERDKRLGENRLFEAELQELIKTMRGTFFPAEGKEPLLGSKLAALPVIDDETVKELINTEKLSRYVSEEELDSLVRQGKYCLIRDALKSPDSEVSAFIGKMYALNDLDAEEIEALSPLHAAFMQDEIYRLSDAPTKKMYRSEAAAVARAAGIEPERYTRELMKRAGEEGHLGQAIRSDFRRVFPFARVSGYLIRLFGLTLLLSLAVGFFTELWLVPIAFLPIMGAVKPITDLLTARLVRGERLARLDIGDLPENCGTLCVLSALVTDEKSLREALSNLKTAKLKNPQSLIYFALLCDLPAADKAELPSDSGLFAEAERLREEIFPECAVIFRRRSYSKTMRKYQGFDRKRGAVEELLRYMNGEKADFYFVSGNTEPLGKCGFIAALDFDTVPLMDSIKQLTAAALHPLNKDYGIIAPRCGSTLSSTLKTPFSRVMAGNGGVSGVSSYDSFCGEFYFDCFGEGIFCGKGLIRKDAFLKKVKGAFPAESVLSHDILEGGLCGVAYDGETEFSDSFPASSKAFFKRSHRWIRGDLQNLRFIFKKGFSPLTRFKLFDNFRRGISPLLIMVMFFLSCFAENGRILSLAAYLCVLLPFLPPIAGSLMRSFAFGVTRRFYSPIVSETAQLALRALTELMTLPKAALVSLDAGAKTLWRTLVTKRNLLQWTTSGVFERTAFKGGFLHLLPSFALSLALLACCVMTESPAVFAALLMCAGFPVLTYCDKPRKPWRRSLSGGVRAELLSQTEKMWRFYTSYTTAETNFLPPDNVQYYPVYRVCPRTSPTNIGMYLLSAVCVRELDIITGETLAQLAEKTLEAVEKLKKWKGNLFNWYDVRSLETVSGFVSSVDSGNFVCCLVTLRQELLKLGYFQLAARVGLLIEGTDISAFYCKRRKLFSIGFDTVSGKLSPHRYDMLMSEARLTSYFAVATGQAPKEHWRALSRTMSRSGRYAGAMAWTGTMFEFFMPELLLTSKEGSMSYEALKFAFHCQKHRHDPFGISESGYYAFDRELNYQYKAHGVQKTALKSGMDRECVVSPYSSYLTLSRAPWESWNNLVKLEKEGAFDPEFGFFEAVDYTRRRVGEKAVVKSHMAHHVGMSIAGAANALEDNICSRLFLSDDKMKRAEELLEERVMAGEKILKTVQRREGAEKLPSPAEETVKQSVTCSPVNILKSGALTLYTSANGRFTANFKGLTVCGGGGDYIYRPSGAFYGICSEKKIYPFFFHGQENLQLAAAFSESSTSYSFSEKELEAEMTVTADPICAEVRRFRIKNKSRSRAQLTLCAYSEPVLAGEADYRAHPMFMDLFLNISFDRENRLFVLYRSDRKGGITAACAAGFMKEEDFTYCLSREECTDYRPFSFFKKARLRENSDNSLPSPCLFIKADMTLDAGESREAQLFFCFGDSVETAVEKAKELRRKGASAAEPNAPSPLSPSTLHGAAAARAIPSILYGETFQQKILESRAKNVLDRHALWKYGISGDQPLLVCGYDGDDLYTAALTARGLEQGGINARLVILCENALEKKAAQEAGAAALVKAELSNEELDLIYALSARILDLPDGREKPRLTKLLPILPSSHVREKSRFDGDSYIVSENGGSTWCNVLANPRFGTLVSQNSLGFTWAKNSRENKLTPWCNDLVRDGTGEMLLLKSGNVFFDLIRGSKAVFSPSLCRWEGKAAGLCASVSLQVYAEEMGKEISVTIENPSEKTAVVQLAYRLEPVLGGDKRNSAPVAEAENGVLTINNPLDPYFHGAMALCCSKPAKFMFSREAFAAGDLSGAVQACGKTSCGMAAAIVPLKLPPRSKERIRFILGYCDKKEKAAGYVNGLDGLPCGRKAENPITIQTPDDSLNCLFNTWLPHQALTCRLWARTGFFQNGGAYGFRDQLQDCLAVMFTSPDIALEHIYRCSESQFFEGDVLHWWHILGEKRAGVRTRYSDDLLWLPYTACEYYEAFGGAGFWEKETAYCSAPLLEEGQQESFTEIAVSDKSESLYLHCKRAMEKGFSVGDNGLLKIGCGDWNDGYNNVGAKGKGESVWLTMFYIICGKKFSAAAKEMKDAAYASELEKRVAQLITAVEENCWDGDRYIRAFYDDGSKMGSADSGSCRIDLLPQAFAALCGLPDTDRTVIASNTAYNELVDEKNGIIKLFSPAFSPERTDKRPGYVLYYPEGIRENGGQYTHGAVWYCLSCFKLGQDKRAFRLLQMLDPSKKGEKFGREPYFMTADIYTNPHCYGRGGWSMYTGAAAWYWRCIFEGLFGAEIKRGKLHLSPRLPAEFDGSVLKIEAGGSKLTLRFVYDEKKKPETVEIDLDGQEREIEVKY